MSTRLPYRCARDDTALASANGALSIGCTAISGTNVVVLAMAAWADIQASIEVLSLYSREPRKPASSAHLAVSTSLARWDSWRRPMLDRHVAYMAIPFAARSMV